MIELEAEVYPINIDWSCCDDGIRDKINNKLIERGITFEDGVVIGEDKEILKSIGEILLEVYKEVSK